MIAGALRRTRPQRPRMARHAGSARAAVAITSRAATAAPGVQPARRSAAASVPDTPNAAADRTAMVRPPEVAPWRNRRAGCMLMTRHSTGRPVISQSDFSP